MFARIESTRNFVPSKSSVKAINSFLIFRERTPEIAISTKIAEPDQTDSKTAERREQRRLDHRGLRRKTPGHQNPIRRKDVDSQAVFDDSKKRKTISHLPQD